MEPVPVSFHSCWAKISTLLATPAPGPSITTFWIVTACAPTLMTGVIVEPDPTLMLTRSVVAVPVPASPKIRWPRFLTISVLEIR
ncbi:hypothetical protein AUP44_02010 [Tistrella mobilis]|uniref:Uncharacterized protein n=1 Tax=Tistrella mobilis TaxID=171437 RepID=A0A161R8X9_9PROT|nr:hypothetical protein AUP44_02010 [Tistrella mobilis]